MGFMVILQRDLTFAKNEIKLEINEYNKIISSSYSVIIILFLCNPFYFFVYFLILFKDKNEKNMKVVTMYRKDDLS